MIKNLGQFTKRLDDISEQVELNTAEEVRELALRVDSKVVLETPVDEGRARANWITSLNRASNETVEPTGGQDAEPPGGGPNAQKSIDQGLAVAAQYQFGQSIFISNNLPYIVKLNEGSSTQAPAGFVEAAVQDGVQAFRKARILE